MVSELHESHVGWVRELCDDTETGKQPTFQRNICITPTIQNGAFYNNRFRSKWFLAAINYMQLREKVMQHKLFCGREMQCLFPKNILTNILAP